MSERAQRDSSHDHAQGGGHADELVHDEGSGAGHGPGADAAARRMAHGTRDLGSFDQHNPPGHALGGKSEHLKPGESICFEVAGNQIYNVVDVTLDPPHGPVTVEKKLVKSMVHGQLGDSNVYRYTFTMSHDAKPGAHVKAHAQATYQSRSDKGWAFAFTIVCG